MKKLNKRFIKNQNTVDQYTCFCYCSCTAYCASRWDAQQQTNRKNSDFELYKGAWY